jgi:hypothetical protein
MRRLVLVLAILVVGGGAAAADREREQRRPPACKCAKPKPRAVVTVVRDGGDAERASAVKGLLQTQRGALVACLDRGQATATLTFPRGARTPRIGWTGAGDAKACLGALSWRDLPRAARRTSIVVELAIEMRR